MARTRRTVKRRIVNVFLTFLVGYAVLCLFVAFFQKRFIYYPFADLIATPKQVGVPFRDVFFEAADGVRIHGWIVEPAAGPFGESGESAGNPGEAAPRPAGPVRANVLFFHGNGGNISYSMETVALFAQLGFRTLFVDYRGYGRSDGRPGERGLHADAEGALDFFCSECGLEPGEIVYVGRSLGGAVALELALRRPPAALVLESPFVSVRAMAGMVRYLLPLQVLLTDRFDNLSRIPGLAVPLLVIHSREDEIVPYGHGRRLFEAAPEPKEFLDIIGDHNGGYHLSGDLYWKGISRFVAEHTP
jgi:pimeloyl-ACP methyl ester carboxylesterase